MSDDRSRFRTVEPCDDGLLNPSQFQPFAIGHDLQIELIRQDNIWIRAGDRIQAKLPQSIKKLNRLGIHHEGTPPKIVVCKRDRACSDLKLPNAIQSTIHQLGDSVQPRHNRRTFNRNRHEMPSPSKFNPLHQFRRDQVVIGFSAADDLDLVAVDHEFDGSWAGVVVAAHSGAVGSGAEGA